MHLRFVRPLHSLLVCLVPLVSVLACSSNQPSSSSGATSAGGANGAGGSTASSTLEYDQAFPQDRVRRVDITITPGNWQSMIADLTAMIGAFGTGGALPGNGGQIGAMPGALDGGAFGGPPMSDAGVPFGPGLGGPPQGGLPPGIDGGMGLMPPQGGDLDGGVGTPSAGGMGGGSVDLIPNTPIYVECDVASEGIALHHVGIRFKGNSSLQMPWAQGIWKLPLRLSFDKFEDQYPETKNQRYYGLQNLSLSNGQSDQSLLRDKLGTEVFARAGLPTPASAFYRIYVDHGEGPTYFGLYTAIELPQDDSFLDQKFKNHAGNLYKPDGVGARWQTWDSATLGKENHESEADFSDAQALFDALHADRSNEESWRAALEARFNVGGFLHWLALNTVVEDWDSYGQMPHNYYLYADPAKSSQFQWIPWDHSYAFTANRSLSLAMTEVTEQWPLIRFLLDDPEYQRAYRGFLAQAASQEYSADWAVPRFQAAHDLIAPYVVGPDGEQPGYTFISNAAAFNSSIAELSQHVASRHTAVTAFLGQ